MAKFCTKCGRPLQEGEICTCDQSQVSATPATQLNEGIKPEEMSVEAASKPEERTSTDNESNVEASTQIKEHQSPQAQQTPPQQTQQVPPQPQTPPIQAQYMKNLFASWTKLFKSPVALGKGFVSSGDMTTAVAFIVIQSLFAGFFGMVVEGKAAKMVNDMMGSFSFLLGGKESVVGTGTYIKILIFTTLFAVILGLVLSGILYVVCMILKVNITFQQTTCIAAMRSIVLIPVMLVSIVVVLLYPAAGVALFYLADIFGLIIVALLMPAPNKEVADKLPLILFVGMVVFVAISFLLMRAGLRFYVPFDYDDLSDILNYIS